MYFAILWKNKEISQVELELIKPQNTKIVGNTIFFESKHDDLIPKLWWIVKWWKLIKIDTIWDHLNEKKIFWVNKKYLGLYCKKELNIKRYKEIELIKTDLEIKKKWIELISWWENNPEVWLILWYQNIDIYSSIDFDKPISGMQIWMMPSKLAHILMNIWLSKLKNEKNITIYDPFVGFWTTWFLANFFDYNFIWSDINITSVKKNLKRWKENKYYKEKKITIYKHDVKNSFEKPFLQNVNLIVTEWWLGPVVKKFTQKEHLISNYKKIYEVYFSFIQNIKNFYEKQTIVMTIPNYMDISNYLETDLIKLFEDLNISYNIVSEVYSRKWQLVGRKIIILNI